MSDYEEGDTPLVITPTSRERGWENRLIKAIDAELKVPFSWEAHNCGDLMATAIRACHIGDHPLLDEITHGTKEQVTADIAKRGGLNTILKQHLQEIPRLRAQDGDLATIGNDPSNCAGAVVLSGMLVGKGEDKVFRLPMSLATHIYRV